MALAAWDIEPTINSLSRKRTLPTLHTNGWVWHQIWFNQPCLIHKPNQDLRNCHTRCALRYALRAYRKPELGKEHGGKRRVASGEVDRGSTGASLYAFS
jgi:hypothetical protein